ncbi:hypothetical protein [Micromonospora sp. ATCC 39149]|uniref:hypothetical protein n=1 Tax=Micromonospora sp. (strain ATCC 39149 / NRRL 15099 / SCC 1413) TaxID=219305 RepID=UPI0002F7372F|nr:hypothetical protein [Micromonospora sp. ATCC 39149]
MSGEQTSVVAAPAVAGPLRQRPGVDPTPAADGTATWTEYVAAAWQLDGVRRSAATAATEQARAVQAAREELTGVRARLGGPAVLGCASWAYPRSCWRRRRRS